LSCAHTGEEAYTGDRQQKTKPQNWEEEPREKNRVFKEVKK